MPDGTIVSGMIAADIDPGVGKNELGVLLGCRIPVDVVAVRSGLLDSAREVAGGAWKAPALGFTGGTATSFL